MTRLVTSFLAVVLAGVMLWTSASRPVVADEIGALAGGPGRELGERASLVSRL